jgi:hypothetical protein
MLDIKPIGKCVILPDDIIKFGSGGSNTIILITKNKQSYKLFPFYFNKLSSDYKKAIEVEKKKL